MVVATMQCKYDLCVKLPRTLTWDGFRDSVEKNFPEVCITMTVYLGNGVVWMCIKLLRVKKYEETTFSNRD